MQSLHVRSIRILELCLGSILAQHYVRSLVDRNLHPGTPSIATVDVPEDVMLRFLTDMLWLGGVIFWTMILCAVILALVFIAQDRKEKKDNGS